MTNQNYTTKSTRKGNRQISPLRQRMIEDMQLYGLSPTTQDRYAFGVQSLARYYNRRPDRISEEEVRSYFMYLKKEKVLAAATIRVILFAVRFFYKKTLGLEWKVLDRIRLPQKKNLPVVLSYEEVKKVLSFVYHPTYRMCLTLIYACGLRLNECLSLRLEDIDSDRMVVRIVNGKGNKMRQVPLPEHILIKLRQYWRIERPDTWLFQSPKTGKPVSASAIQAAFRDARQKAGIKKKAAPHTLRHCYATHLLENRVDTRIIQSVPGHKNASSTNIYTHLTSKTDLILSDALNKLMTGL